MPSLTGSEIFHSSAETDSLGYLLGAVLLI